MHNVGIVHRDVKPANFIWTQNGESEVIKLVDFGLAKSFVVGSESSDWIDDAEWHGPCLGIIVSGDQLFGYCEILTVMILFILRTARN